MDITTKKGLILVFGKFYKLEKQALKKFGSILIDAQARGIKTGDMIQVRNDLGIIQRMAKVTPKIILGCAVTPQGAWAKYENGIDAGTCVNSLASIVPTAISKGNGQYSILSRNCKNLRSVK